MNLISSLAALMRWNGWPVVSLYFPTDRAKLDFRQDPVRLKKALKEAEEKLVQAGLRSPDARKMLSPAHFPLEDPANPRGDGMAFFADPTRHELHHLPFDVPERVVVAGHVHLKPMLPLLAGDGLFQVLAVSQKEVRLLEATRDGVRRLHLEQVPMGVDEALKYDVVQVQRFLHVLPAQGGHPSRERALFHGHGEGSADSRKTRATEYLRQVARGIESQLHDLRAPIVFSGAEWLLPILREASGWPNLLDEFIAGNSEMASDDELRSRAWAIVGPRFDRIRRDDEERFDQLAGSGRTTTSLAEVVRAAHEGLVETLFAAADAHVWGWYHEDSRQLVREDDLPAAALGGGEDLVDRAAVETAVRRGKVYITPRERMPVGSELAAILRYAAPLS
ncbi:MAG: hypothetical protein ACREAA_00350 [Candidatus Polarisedimenticolia bacterium]